MGLAEWVTTSQPTPRCCNSLSWTPQNCARPMLLHWLYKIWSHVLQGYADKMQPLHSAVAGKQSHDHITWTEELLKAFRSAQHALNDCKIITLPHPSDTLCLVTDASVKEGGLLATLYVLRDNKLHLAGFFSARLRKHQVTWLPCEVVA